jgi:hypothetical protein
MTPTVAMTPPTAVAERAPDPEDPLHAFIQQWPRVETELTRRQAARLVWEGTPCAGYDDRNAEPGIGKSTPASVSPDGRTLVVIATLELDHAGAAAIGLVHGTREDEGSGTLAVVFDGPSGAFWAHSLQQFQRCNVNPHGFRWSADSRRVYVGTDTGHGERVALVDVAASAVRFQGFVGLEVASPGLQHVAWTPWFSGFPFADNKPGQVNGDVLEIDDHQVWGSSNMNAAEIWGVAWESDTTLTFCGHAPKQRVAKLRAVLAGNTVKVIRIGADCPPDGARWSTFD